MWSKLLVFVILIYGCCHSFDVSFTIQPESVNTTLNVNSTVNFTCGAVNATLGIVFFVLNDTGGNPIAASSSELVDRGFTERPLTMDGNRTLSVEATETNNDTTIFCSASPGNIRSELALLLIQGPLASVGDLRATILNGGSSVQLTWTEPYTLDSVPINGYSINGQSTLVNTTDTILYSTNNPVDPCNETTAVVSAVNGAGEGEPANVSFYYERVPQVVPANTTYLDLSINDDEGQVTLHVTVNVSQHCPGEFPSIATVYILYSDGAIQCNTSSLRMSDDQLLTGNITLSYNQTFIVNVSLSNAGGEFLLIQFECAGSVCTPIADPSSPSPTPTFSSPTTTTTTIASISSTGVASPSPTRSNGPNDNIIGVIVGAAVGGVLLITLCVTVIIAILIWKIKTHNKIKRTGTTPNEATSRVYYDPKTGKATSETRLKT